MNNCLNISFEINYYSVEAIDEVNCSVHTPKWVYDVAGHIGEKAKLFGETYILKGIQETNEDFYYILSDEDGELIYESCCSIIEFENKNEEHKDNDKQIEDKSH